MPHPAFEDLRRAVEAALARGDDAAALAVVRRHAREAAAEHGAEFRSFVVGLPSTVWSADAVVTSAMGASYRASGSPRGSSALGYFDAADASLRHAGREVDADRVAAWLGRAAAFRTLGQLDAARDDIQRARELRDEAAMPVSTRVELDARLALEGGIVDLHLGRVDAARRQLEHAHGLAAEHLTRAEHVECLGALALAAYVTTGLSDATRHSAEALDLAGDSSLRRSGYAAPALLARSLCAIDRHDLDAATEFEPEMLAAAGSTEWEPFAFTTAGYRRLAGRDLAEGLDHLQRARHGYRTWAPPGLGLSAADLMRASVLMHTDQGDEAWAIIQSLPEYEHHVICTARLVAQLRLLHGDLEGAAEALVECERIAADHSQRTLVDVRMLRSAIALERGDHRLSDVSFDRALAALARDGSRAALRLVPPGTLAELARRAATRAHSAEGARIVGRIVEATEGFDRAIEPLSAREVHVLAEVVRGATVADIAAALFVSPNTVKTHLRRLYRKLGVTTRADAIRKAKSLGLGQPITRDSPE